MNVAYLEKDVFEDFNPVLDAYLFRIGSHGLVSFYGRNYTKKMRLTSEEQTELMNHPNFLRVANQCYVNTAKIASAENHVLYFQDKISYPMTLNVSRRTEQEVRRRLQTAQ